MKNAEANAEADKKRKEEVDLRNEVDQAIFTTEKTIKETEGKGFDAERDAAQTGRFSPMVGASTKPITVLKQLRVFLSANFIGARDAMDRFILCQAGCPGIFQRFRRRS